MEQSEELQSEIAQKMSLDQVRYSQVWEDHTLLEQGLKIAPDDDILSICSAGDNALAMLLQGPRSVTAIDMNPAQTALLELKLAAIRSLNHADFVILLGIRDGSDRLQLFEKIKGQLSEEACAFWEANQEDIVHGLVHCGRLESYFHTFLTDHLSKIWSDEVLHGLFAERSLQDQKDYFYSQAATPEFEECFRWYFGREKMAEQGRDPAQFEHVEEGDVGGYFFKRFSYACTELPLHTNFYVEHFLTCQYRDLTIAPPYLRPQNYERLRSLIDRVRIHTGELEGALGQHPEGHFSKANLSDIFEYMSPELNEAVFSSLGRHMRSGGRIAYWNLLVPRSSPESLRELLRPHPELGVELHAQDRSWFYRAFHIEEVL